MIKHLLRFTVIGLIALFLTTGCGNSGADLSNPLSDTGPSADQPKGPGQTPSGNKTSGSETKTKKKESKKESKKSKDHDDDDDDDKDDDHDDDDHDNDD